jgi:hypothetical protein
MRIYRYSNLNSFRITYESLIDIYQFHSEDISGLDPLTNTGPPTDPYGTHESSDPSTTDANSTIDDEQSIPDPGCQELDDLPSGPSDIPRPGAEEALPQSLHDVDLEELSDLARLDQLKISMEFIRALENASLDDPEVGLDPESLRRL